MKAAKTSFRTIELGGGWDTSTPDLKLKPGVMRSGINYECAVNGGYTRTSGYERYNGRTAPSSAAYTVIYTDAFATVPVVGDTINGTSSGATGYVFNVDIATRRIVVTKVTSAFATTEEIRVGVSVVGNRVAQSYAFSASFVAELTGLAADVYRADIDAVGGAACTGPALGAVLYKDVLYAFRANAAQTNVLCYKSSSTGWVAVPYYAEVYFTSTTATEPAEGTTIVQGGAQTQTIKRVVLQSGAWGTNAAGKFIITTTAGANFAAGAATISTGSVTLSGAQYPITLAVESGAKFEFDQWNFYAGLDTYRVYGCDGANRAFEFDGDVLVPIDTFTPRNLTLDKPTHLSAHLEMLFLTIGASLTWSVPGLPYNYQAVSYAGEKGFGQKLTGLKVLPGVNTTSTLLITAQNNTYILYGTGYATFNWVTYSPGVGARDYTIQNMADTFMMDDSGVVTLKASQNFGNFDQASITQNIAKFIEQNRTSVSCSTVNRRKSQYRLFFTSGYALYITVVNGNVVGIAPIAFPDVAYTAISGEYSTGRSVNFFCGTDGFVYQMDSGTSFDGEAITGYFTLKFDHVNSERVRKRFRKAAVEISGSGYSVVNFGYLLGYGVSEISQDNYGQYEASTAPPQWDSFTWDSFTWDGVSVVPSECEMKGTAINVAVTIRSNSPYFREHTINNITLHYSDRRAMR